MCQWQEKCEGNSGSNDRYTGHKCVSKSTCTMPSASGRISPNCRPTMALIPGGAIDVAARLTRTCHDTRRRRARTCSSPGGLDDEPTTCN